MAEKSVYAYMRADTKEQYKEGEYIEIVDFFVDESKTYYARADRENIIPKGTKAKITGLGWGYIRIEYIESNALIERWIPIKTEHNSYYHNDWYITKKIENFLKYETKIV